MRTYMHVRVSARACTWDTSNENQIVGAEILPYVAFYDNKFGSKSSRLRCCCN